MISHFEWARRREDKRWEDARLNILKYNGRREQKEHVARTKRSVLWISEIKYTVPSLVLGIGQERGVQVQEMTSE